MKRLLLAVVLVSATISPSVQAHYCGDYPCRQCEADAFVGKVMLATAAAGLGAWGAWTLFNKLPSRQYAAAQKVYLVLDGALVRLFEEFDASQDDIAIFAAQIYPSSPYPIVTLFNTLDKAQNDVREALVKLENAMWWSKEESFTKACESLKKNLKKRLAAYGQLSSLIRAHSDWQSGYSLYLQKCQNDELRNLSTQVALNGLNRTVYHCHHHC